MASAVSSHSERGEESGAMWMLRCVQHANLTSALQKERDVSATLQQGEVDTSLRLRSVQHDSVEVMASVFSSMLNKFWYLLSALAFFIRCGSLLRVFLSLRAAPLFF